MSDVRLHAPAPSITCLTSLLPRCERHQIMKKRIHPASRIAAHACAYAPPLPPPVPPSSLGRWRLELYLRHQGARLGR
eukprot:7294395-Prymnesium_polylepis.1